MIRPRSRLYSPLISAHPNPRIKPGRPRPTTATPEVNATIIILEPSDVLPGFMEAIGQYACKLPAVPHDISAAHLPDATAECVRALVIPPPPEQYKILATLADVAGHVPYPEAIMGPIFRLLLHGDPETCQKIIDAYVRYLAALQNVHAVMDGA